MIAKRNPIVPPLEIVHVESWLASQNGRKITVDAHLLGKDGTATVQTTGLFLIPSWAEAGGSGEVWEFAEG